MNKRNYTILLCFIFGIMFFYDLSAQKALLYSSIDQQRMEDGRTQYVDKEKGKPLNGDYKIEGTGMNRNAYFIAKYKKGYLTDLMTEYDRRGNKIGELYYDDGNLNVKKTFSSDGSITRVTHFKDNMLDGADTEYFTDGAISRETNYKQGKQDGSEKSYHYQTHKLILDKNYVDGVLNGNQKESRSSDKEGDYTIESVYDMGKIVSLKETYDNGTLKKIRETGSDRSYTEKSYLRDGSVDSEFSYNDKGELEGMQTYYFPDGKIKIESPYRNGQKDGIRKEYYQTGQLKAEESYSDGYKKGSWIEYYPNGQKKTEWVCDKDRYHGPYKIYYEDGKVQEEGETNYEEYVYRKIYYKNGQLKIHMAQDSARGLTVIESYEENGKQL